MKRLSNIPGPKRIVVYFVLAIVLPSILMGALAFRGIKNDQALIERENRRQALENGGLIIEFTNDILSNLEKEFEIIVQDRPDVKGAFFSDPFLKDFIECNQIVSGISYVDEDEVKMFDSPLQYLPKDIISAGQQPNLLVSAKLEIGWEYEYQDQDNGKALSYYLGIMPKLDDEYSKAIALNAIARLQKKEKAFEAAVESYEMLSQAYGDYFINKTIPLGLVTDVELAKLFVEQGDMTRALQAQLRLQQNIVNRKWKLDEGSYTFFTTKTGEFLHDQKDILESNNQVLLARFNSLQQEQQKLQLETRNLLSLRKNSLPKIYNSEINSRERRLEESGGSLYLISVIPGQSTGRWCILTATDRLLEHYIEPRLRIASSKGRWLWSLQNDRGEILVHPDEAVERTDFVEIRFPAQLPAWTLLAYTKPLTFFQTFLQSDQGVFFFMFLFIGAVLIVGLSFIFYSVNRELQLTEMKSDFIATVSHEFKSPLTAIRQITEMLQSDRVPIGKREKYYSVMLQQGARLTHLIDNFLDFSRIERGKRSYIFEATDIAQLIRTAAAQYQRRIGDKSFQINLSIDPELPEVRIDGDAIEQVLHNLLDNAVKFSGDSKVIDLRTENDNGTIITSVRDYGIGIPKEEQSRIFERFYRADDKKTHDIKGSGIGLTLVKEIVEAHGGKIHLDSSRGKGSTFYFYLPINKT